MRVTILRSRFQPFTKYHLDAINWYFNNQAEFNFPEYLVLCLVRDYDTLHQRLRLSPEVAADDLRHVSMFNPLSSWDIRWILARCFPRDLMHRIIVIEVPLKFKELLRSIYNKGEIIVPSLKRYFRFLREQEFLQRKKERCSKVKECKRLQINEERVGRWFALQAYDASPFPESEDVMWLFPVFDIEDFDDWSSVVRQYGEERTIPLPMMESYVYQPVTFADIPQLGAYGIFVYYNYLLFKNAKGNELNVIESGLPSLCDQLTSDFYLTRAKEWKEKTSADIGSLEISLLQNVEEFIHCCRKTLSVVSDTSYTSRIRKFFHLTFERKKAELLASVAQACTTGLKTTTGYENETWSLFDTLLRSINGKLTNGHVTFHELKQKSPHFDEIWQWKDINEIDRERIRQILANL